MEIKWNPEGLAQLQREVTANLPNLIQPAFDRFQAGQVGKSSEEISASFQRYLTESGITLDSATVESLSQQMAQGVHVEWRS
jgi:hypothetical protein